MIVFVLDGLAELQSLADSPDAATDGSALESKTLGGRADAKNQKGDTQPQEATLGITAKKATNFADWYTQVIGDNF